MSEALTAKLDGLTILLVFWSLVCLGLLAGAALLEYRTRQHKARLAKLRLICASCAVECPQGEVFIWDQLTSRSFCQRCYEHLPIVRQTTRLL